MGEKTKNDIEQIKTSTPSLPSMNRRDFFKVSGIAAAAAGAASVGGIGYLNGASPFTHTGWENTQVKEYFDRRPFEVDKPKYNQVGTPKRVSYLTHRFSRFAEFKTLNLDDPSSFSPDLRKWYEQNPEARKLDKELITKVLPEKKKTVEKIGHKFILHNAYFGAYGATKNPKFVDAKPEVFDWDGVADPPYEVKDPEDMSRLIKQVGRLFGSSLVRIAKFNPVWAYDRSTGGRGYQRGEEIKVPDWWQYAIVVGVPHEWHQKEANPTFGHSMDAYNEATIVAHRMTSFIKSLGYAARPHTPDGGYEVIIPPILVDAGVGEQGRFGFVVTPEFGGNFRPAVITTNLPLKPDRPIDIGVREFCEKCKICAETCPSESISFEGPKEIRGRGFDGWQINIETCHNYWMSVPGSNSCRICLAVCPFSRKSNWLHTTARNIAVRDKTGVAASSLTWMEKTFYGQQDPTHFLAPNWGTVGEPPWWFDVDRFLKVKK